MKPCARNHNLTMLLLLAALMMRAGIPDGYMPAAAGSGQLFELCPAGVSMEFMAFLSGEHHNHQADGSSTHFDASQCPIGHMLSAAVAVDSFSLANSLAPPELPAIGPAPVLFARAVTTHRSRDPPA